MINQVVIKMMILSNNLIDSKILSGSQQISMNLNINQKIIKIIIVIT